MMADVGIIAICIASVQKVADFFCRVIFGFFFVVGIPLTIGLVSLGDALEVKIVSGLFVSFWMLLIVAPRKCLDIQ